MDLRGKLVLITGGSRGLGLALAREFACQGARVAICARDPDELTAAQSSLEAFSQNIYTFKCDLTDAAQVQELIDRVESTCGNIDVLVNNAGTIVVGPAEVMSADDFAEAMDVNLWAAVHTTLAIVPRMRERGRGRIVNIGSVGGKIPMPHMAAYCASKFALVGFSGAMRSELSKYGILVTTVNPGLTRTGSPRNAIFKGNHRAEYAWFSISDSLPGLSMSARCAAEKIVRATIYGDAELVLGLPAKAATVIYGVAPNFHIEMAAVANRAFPNADGHDRTRKAGRDSESWLTRSFVRHLGQQAERDYNQGG
jgi:short-subunit dehydrogenase